MDPSTSAAELQALHRYDYTTWDDVLAVLSRHGFEIAQHEHAGRTPEPMWLVTSQTAPGVSLITDTQLLFFAMGLAAAEPQP